MADASDDPMNDLTQRFDNWSIESRGEQESWSMSRFSRSYSHNDTTSQDQESRDEQESLSMPRSSGSYRHKGTTSQDQGFEFGRKGGNDGERSPKTSRFLKETQQENMSEIVTTQKIEIDTQDHQRILQKLDFQEHFVRKFKAFDGKFEYVNNAPKFYLQCQCTAEMKNEIEKNMNEFISSVRAIPLDQNAHDLLSMNNCTNVSFLEKELDKAQVCGFLKIQSGKTIIYSVPENAKEVVNVVMSSFIQKTVSSEQLEYFYFTTSAFQDFKRDNEGRTLKIERKDCKISFIAIRPTGEELLHALAKYENGSQPSQLTLTSLQEKAIELWKPELREDIHNQNREKVMRFLSSLHAKGKYVYTRKTLLLMKKQTKEYVDKKFAESKISVLFEVESVKCVNLISLQQEDTAKAEAVLEDAICVSRMCNTDVFKEKKNSRDFQKLSEQWDGKFHFDGEDEEEEDLLATKDAIDSIHDFFKGPKITEGNRSSGRELEENSSVETKLVIKSDQCGDELQIQVQELERKYRCRISKELHEPQLGNCWLLGKDKENKVSRFFRVHRISGHAEYLNVEALVWPCTTCMLPLSGYFRQYDHYALSQTKKHDIGYMHVEERAMQKIINLVTCKPNANNNDINLKSLVHHALVKADELSCKSVALPASLLPTSVQDVKQQRKAISSAFKCEYLPNLKNLEEIFVCESSDHLLSDGEEHWKRVLCEIERFIDFKSLHESAVRMGPVPENKAADENIINVQIVKGSLVSKQVDAIVNTCRKNLDLRHGAISKTILEKGGNDIQTALKKSHPKGISFGEVAETRGGHLPCKYIFHSALYYWTPNGNFSLKILKLMIWNCLTKADEMKCKSIAFPSLGTGQLNHPFCLVAETMYQTVQTYGHRNRDTGIKDVAFVLYEKDVECVQQFEMVEMSCKRGTKLFQAKEEKHPYLFYTNQYLLASRIVWVDLLPSRSTWKWGSLLKLSFDSGNKKKAVEWDDVENCWNLLISPLGIMPSVTSYIKSPNPAFEEILIQKRISSIELILVHQTEGDLKRQIDDFLWMMDRVDQDHFVQHVFIAFPSEELLQCYVQGSNGHWKRGQRSIPITYTVTGDTKVVPKVKQELEEFLHKTREKTNKRMDEHSQNGYSASSLKGLGSFEDDIPIFESVSATIHSLLPLDAINEVVREFGCTIATDTSRGLSVRANDVPCLLQVNEKLTKLAEKVEMKNQNDAESIESGTSTLHLKMSECEFNSFIYFGKKEGLPEYKNVANKLRYENDELQVDHCDEKTAKALQKHFEKIRTLNTGSYNVPQGLGSKIPTVIERCQEKYPDACFFEGKSIIVITCDDYGRLQFITNAVKRETEGEPKGRRNRKFEVEASEHGEAKKMSTSRRNRSFESTGPVLGYESRSSRETFEVKTKEGLIVKVYQGSITSLSVDCIVNAANDKLMHGGGVAYAISEAAGADLDRESIDYIQKYGPIPVGKCCVTTAGKLHYKCVIHTVGPRWSDYRNDDKQFCLNDLQEAVEVTFREAERLQMKSIAVPAISSGIFGVPQDMCAEQYYKAALTFSASDFGMHLKEIHFVDRDPTMVAIILRSFAKMKSCLTSPSSGDKAMPDYPTFSAASKSNSEAYQASSHQLPITEEEEKVVFNISDSLSVFLQVGALLKSAGRGVVCPQDKKCLSRGNVARLLMDHINDSSVNPPKKDGECSFGDVFPVKCKRSSSVPWDNILHTVSPTWEKDFVADKGNYKKILTKTYKRIFEATEREQISNIVIPVLGMGALKDYPTCLDTCADAFLKAVKVFSEEHDETNYLQEIQVIFENKEDINAYINVLNKSGYEEFQIPGRQGKDEDNSSSVTKGKEVIPEEENCCICMDTPTNPKRLHICGHVFCTECIEQQFMYKPACPSCGQLYGKMTGDQPPGSVFVRKEWRKLPGYEHCDGCIVITYNINGGYQGDEHPNPTKYFKGISRSGYIPNNTKGRLVVKLLNVAFTRRLVFTIGRSRTTGEEGVVTWNDIHHKTRPEGGPQRFGYPDPTYLDRVLEELAAKGVSPESADDPKEYMEYSKCFR